ncbi:MAG: type I restriction enzyme HsdR N-terminal domain-containing protein, partial [Deltaproteobacteria bacterium]|nr:type I restriction enzyme HsdR N-terminal domain-containing protein [Deltaproteobacteria bacterium]
MAVQKPFEMIEDYLTGEPVPLVGAEGNRQALLRYLVEERGFARADLARDVPLSFRVEGVRHDSALDLVLSWGERPVVVFKVAAGSLGSREREAVAAARLAPGGPAHIAAVSDGKTATVLDAATGKPMGTGLDSLPGPEEAKELAARPAPAPLEGKRLR